MSAVELNTQLCDIFNDIEINGLEENKIYNNKRGRGINLEESDNKILVEIDYEGNTKKLKISKKNVFVKINIYNSIWKLINLRDKYNYNNVFDSNHNYICWINYINNLKYILLKEISEMCIKYLSLENAIKIKSKLLINEDMPENKCSCVVGEMYTIFKFNNLIKQKMSFITDKIYFGINSFKDNDICCFDIIEDLVKVPLKLSVNDYFTKSYCNFSKIINWWSNDHKIKIYYNLLASSKDKYNIKTLLLIFQRMDKLQGKSTPLELLYHIFNFLYY